MTNISVINDETGDASDLQPEKIASTLRSLAQNLFIKDVDFSDIASQIVNGLPKSVQESSLIQFGGEVLAGMTTKHPDYAILAARWEICHLHKKLAGLTFCQNLGVIRLFRLAGDKRHSSKKHKPSSSAGAKCLISDEFYEMALRHQKILDAAIKPERDYDFSYFGWKTLCKSYLIKFENKTVHETPQFLFMRVAIAIHGRRGNIDAVLETYDLMSRKMFIHASPTLFNAGTVAQYLSSCFLVGMIEDSIDGIYRTLHKTAMISKASGGVGIHVSNIRGAGAYISGSNGTSNGLVPMLRVFNNTARYVDQGGNKRPGAFCIYLEPWHCDVFDFLQLRKNQGKEELRARDLFIALWIPDLFMERVQQNGTWSLFSPDEAPGLQDCYGEEFNELYKSYEESLTPTRVVQAHELWYEILQSQVETGGPFMLYKDSCNRKSNQQNLGTIKSSNLCCEIVQYSSPEEVAVCNLASVALPSFIKVHDNEASFDFKALHDVVRVIAGNLDEVIDVCEYPVEEAERSNKRHRPISIGVQGLADAFMLLRFPYHSQKARILNKHIFETIYHAAVETSIERAKRYGRYSTFDGSPASKGLLQFDLWELDPEKDDCLYGDWHQLKNDLKMYGMRNSLLVGPMPTASTSQILGFTESFEPVTSNIYTRRVLSGEFTMVNKYMVNDFCKLGIWNEKLKNRIIKDNGSIRNIAGIPDNLKDLYQTVWEIPQRVLIDLAADRSPFIDQSQSLNLYMKQPTMGKLTSMHFYAWKKGLKTGMYYLRTQAASSAIQFTINEDNTLLDSVNIQDNSKVLELSVYGLYPAVCDAKQQLNDTGKTVHKLNSKEVSESQNMQGGKYGIHDSKPLKCTLGAPETHCESCSG